MGCDTNQSDSRLRVLEREAAKLRRDLSLSREIAGVTESPLDAIVQKISCDYDGESETFTIVIPSQPTDAFQVQISENGVDWTELVHLISADPAPAVTTEWVSGVYSIDDTPGPYFRFRKYPSCSTPCAASACA